VSLVIKELKDAMSWDILQVLDEFPTELKGAYRQMLGQIERLQRQLPTLCQEVLSAIVVSYRPLHLQELYSLSSLPSEVKHIKEFTTIVKMCGSFLTIRDDIVYIVHQSVKDFLCDETNQFIFTRGIGFVHFSILSKSLQVMTKTLRRDIFDLREPGFPIERVQTPNPDPLIAARYSCVYWVDHLCDWYDSCQRDEWFELPDGGTIDVFIKEKYLYWLEALSLCGNMPKGVLAMSKLRLLIQVGFRTGGITGLWTILTAF
jgi:hypothetical protein